MDEVNYVSGSSRLYGIVGHPIEQVRSPETVTAEFVKATHDGILVPFHVLPEDFDSSVAALLRMPNLGGLVFTIPFKERAVAFANSLGRHAQAVGAINAIARDDANGWKGEMFDGIGCVEGFRRRGISFEGKRVLLIGAGGAGSAIAAAIADEKPNNLRIYDLNTTRLERLISRLRSINAGVDIEAGAPDSSERDILLNATPVGMLGDQRLPINADRLPPSLTVFDAIVKPDITPLLKLAEASGCTTVRGREMMAGQMWRIAKYLMRAPD
jgi:shikimate dehydrogenase